MKYEVTIGLETHVELSTKSKIFCSCSTEFGASENSHCCPVCLGLPGSLPIMNKAVVEYAVKAGIALNCDIALTSYMDRKNYVYPDLPGAYQLSQFEQAICTNGYVELLNGKKIRIHQMHMEEDAGKLVHSKGDMLIDYNRGSVPLLEVVTEPDFTSAVEVREYLEQLQQIMRYVGVSDCKMQEGSMRCDVNISLRPVGQKELGVRAEIKNMNSLSFMEKAIEYEIKRHTEALDSGTKLIQETRRFNDATGETEGMRDKENAMDYRYFRDPNLLPINITKEFIEKIRADLPEFPRNKVVRFTNVYGIPQKDAQMICKFKKISDFFDEACNGIENKKIVSNFMIGQIFAVIPTEADRESGNISITPLMLNELVKLIESGKVSMNKAKEVLDRMLAEGKPHSEYLNENDLVAFDSSKLIEICKSKVAENPKAVADYKDGKTKAYKAIIGAVMKETEGKADPQEVDKLIVAIIEKM